VALMDSAQAERPSAATPAASATVNLQRRIVIPLGCGVVKQL
jgi:hypothetical protein